MWTRVWRGWSTDVVHVAHSKPVLVFVPERVYCLCSIETRESDKEVDRVLERETETVRLHKKRLRAQ